MINLKLLREFLTKTKKLGYASGKKAQKIKEKDISKTIISTDGHWKCHDNYFGGEPYGGREVVFFKNKPVYMIVYYGYVNKSHKDFKKVYKFLQEALLVKQKSYFIVRGPKKYKQGDFIYVNKFKGRINNFSGQETIYFKSKKIYKATYAGGLVDQRKEKNA